MTLPIKYSQIFVNNEFIKSKSGKVFPVLNPSTAEKICDVQEGSQFEVDLAVTAAKRAFKLNSIWRTMDASARGKLIYKLADLVERDAKYLAKLETLNNGKPIWQSEGDIDVAIRILRYYAGYADKIHGKTLPVDGDLFCMTLVEPVGVCGAILPWNFPIKMTSNKIAPALAAGNVVIIKPAEQTPLTALYLAALTKEAGFPPGVINVIPGYGPTAGAAICSHLGVDHVSFTGSTQVGKIVQETAGKTNAKRVTLEMGGKCPMVVMDDADLNLAVRESYDAAFFNQGQCCSAGSRTFVQEGIYDAFVSKIRDMTMKTVVGDPFKESTQQGPQIDNEQFTKILKLIEVGKKEGAKVECGGGRVQGLKGYFVQPTVFSNCQDDMVISKEEIFGPVLQVYKFKTMEEVIERSNNTLYGLAAGICTKDINKAMTYFSAVRAGTIWVNTFLIMTPNSPFGGYKMSGHGRELGEEALKEYTEIKTITIKFPEKKKLQ